MFLCGKYGTSLLNSPVSFSHGNKCHLLATFSGSTTHSPPINVESAVTSNETSKMTNVVRVTVGLLMLCLMAAMMAMMSVGADNSSGSHGEGDAIMECFANVRFDV